ncbi:GAD-like domain-containing protein [Xenorhabdus bovienii]|nr:GAD-like domain-containing protein [Xenorhabdus bovienii]
MRDEFFDYFIEKMGEATQHREVTTEAIEKWRGKLPDRLLHY